MASEAPKKLVLCFDGTSNKFNANEEDTNIVRIYEMLDRNTNDQFHYYQPGIGTYTEGPMTNSTDNGWLRNTKMAVSKTMDQMFGTSFVHHVVAGYQFILRYYSTGDKIYIFGFSRGAYTARYLCEMIDNIGLLSRGNDEMIRFAWDTFSDYQRIPGGLDPDSDLAWQERMKSFHLPTHDDKESQHERDAALYTVPKDQTYKRPRWFKKPKPQTKEEALKYMLKFRETYCRKYCVVHFLGLFDCVASVNQFNASRLSSPDTLRVPADFVRHAVSMDERRIKFKPSLFSTEPHEFVTSKLKEVWFAGNHGDVGGGWNLKIKPGCKEKPQYLLSDIALQWMVQEVRNVDQQGKSDQPPRTPILNWREPAVEWLNLHVKEQMKSWEDDTQRGVVQDSVHDPLCFRRGLEWYQVLQWRFMELIPLPRYSLVLQPDPDDPTIIKEAWKFKHFPANFGERRDIPSTASFHTSVYTLSESKKGFCKVPMTKLGHQGNWFVAWFMFLIGRELAEEPTEGVKAPTEDRTATEIITTEVYTGSS